MAEREERMTQLLFHTDFPSPVLLSHYGGCLIFALQTWRFSLRYDSLKHVSVSKKGLPAELK